MSSISTITYRPGQQPGRARGAARQGSFLLGGLGTPAAIPAARLRAFAVTCPTSDTNAVWAMATKHSTRHLGPIRT